MACNELFHYGILGMKWGIRRSQKELDRLAGRNGDITYKKGTKIHRMTGTKNEKHSGTTYASVTDFDRGVYQLQGYMNSARRYVKSYELTMSAAEDIVIPSLKKRVDAMLELADEDPQFVAKAAAAINRSRRTSLRDALSDIDSNKRVKAKDFTNNKNKSEVEKDATYKKLSAALGFDKDVMQKYVGKLSKMGYNATIDDFDSGRTSEQALIIFDRAKSLTVGQVTETLDAYDRSQTKKVEQLIDKYKDVLWRN